MIIGDGIMLGAGGETASIVVTAPTGSTVTCTTPAGIVLTTAEIGGTWTFAKLKVYGTYTVTATDGTITKTQDVLVDSASTYEIKIVYVQDKTFTLTDLSSAATMVKYSGRCSFSTLTNQYAGTDGLKIYGTNNIATSDWDAVLAFPAWVIKADLTGYSTLSWHFIKVNDHGSMKVSIIKDAPTASTLNSSCAKTSLTVHRNAPTSWTEYSYDVSDLDGEYYLLFQSGWLDTSGNSYSEGRYSNIRLLV